ncbi:MAG TPA: NlpC/P60 family protein [Candidatus Kapabacteria bacterium]|nr:NlpC/P60 family protein [Candidatus Kapabacteria bacterium]
MIFEKSVKINRFIYIFLIIIIFVTTFTDASARRRTKKSSKRKSHRVYNPNVTKQQAMDIIRSSSETISEMVGIEANLDSNNANSLILQNEGEILDAAGDHGEDITELEKEDDVTVSMDEFNNLWMSYMDESVESQFTNFGIKKSEIMDEIMQRLGTPYLFGGTSDRAIDCSAFTQRIFLDAANVLLPRVAREQVNVGKKVKRNDLQFGDLVFFLTYSKRFASHVGIYLGDNLFAHASSRYGVTVSSLESSYYKKAYYGARRLTSKDVEVMSVKPQDYLNATRKK